MKVVQLEKILTMAYPSRSERDVNAPLRTNLKISYPADIEAAAIIQSGNSYFKNAFVDGDMVRFQLFRGSNPGPEHVNSRGMFPVQVDAITLYDTKLADDVVQILLSKNLKQEFCEIGMKKLEFCIDNNQPYNLMIHHGFKQYGVRK
jgi:hypothetical protein